MVFRFVQVRGANERKIFFRGDKDPALLKASSKVHYVVNSFVHKSIKNHKKKTFESGFVTYISMFERRKNRRFWTGMCVSLCTIFIAFFSFTTMACAQAPNVVVPDAGSLLNQIERSLPPPKMPVVGAPAAPPKIDLLKGSGETFALNRILFEGNLAIKSPELEKVAASYLNRAVFFTDLQNLAAEISLLYRQRGYIATVSIPHQIVVRGIVRLKILEARFSGAKVDPNSNGRLSEEFIVNRFEAALKPGELVDVYKLDRALLLLNDLPGTSISGGLDSGDHEGESRFVALSERKSLLTGNASFDNYGARSTGSLRFNADTSLNNALGVGDQLSFNALHTLGSDYGRFAVSFPVSENGLRLGVSGSAMSYQLVAAELKAGNFAGTSHTYGVDLTYPLIRTRSFNLSMTANYDGREFSNTANRVISSQYRSDAVSTGFTGNVYDEILEGGINTFSLAATAGYLDLNGSPTKAGDAATTQAQKQFAKLKGSLSRTQTLTEELAAFVSVSGQYGFKNLDSSEKFFLGGASGVRAYPTSEGGGSSGIASSAELRYKLPYDVLMTAFYDIGAVEQNRQNTYSGALPNNNLLYRGYGLSALWQGPYNSTYKLVWAHRLGDNPNPNAATGRDQDGTKRVDRYWLSVSGGF